MNEYSCQPDISTRNYIGLLIVSNVLFLPAISVQRDLRENVKTNYLSWLMISDKNK